MATTPGPRRVLGAATPEAGPGSPAPRPARPNLRRATGRCGWGKRKARGRFRRRFLPCRVKLMGKRRYGGSLPFMGRFLLLGGLDRESSDPDLVLSAVREMSGPSWVFSGASEVGSEVLGAVRS